MVKNKKKFPSILFVASVLIVSYLKIRDYLLIGSLSCGLGFYPCPSVYRFLLDFCLWIIVIFIILFLLKYFSYILIFPEKKVVKKSVPKKVDKQASKKSKKPKKDNKEKKEKVKKVDSKKEKPALIDDLDENDTWDEVEVEAEKNGDDEVINI